MWNIQAHLGLIQTTYSWSLMCGIVVTLQHAAVTFLKADGSLEPKKLLLLMI